MIGYIRSHLTIRTPDTTRHARHARRDQRRQRFQSHTTPMPWAVWIVFAVFAATSVFGSSPGASSLPGLVIIGALIFWYQQARARIVARNIEDSTRRGRHAMVPEYTRVEPFEPEGR